MYALPGPPLDPPTLLFSISLVSGLMSAFAYSTARAMPEQRRCLNEWARANLAAGIAFLLYFLRGHIPFAISFLVANLAVLVVPILMLRALARLVGEVRQASDSITWAFSQVPAPTTASRNGMTQVSAPSASRSVGPCKATMDMWLRCARERVLVRCDALESPRLQSGRTTLHRTFDGCESGE